jgi:FkbM family methyltransferase
LDLLLFETIRPTSVQNQELLKKNSIDLVIDVGANVGQFSDRLRRYGYLGPIVAFEPDADSLSIFRRRFAKDKLVSSFSAALSDCHETKDFYVARDSACSGLNKQTDEMITALPDSEIVD